MAVVFFTFTLLFVTITGLLHCYVSLLLDLLCHDYIAISLYYCTVTLVFFTFTLLFVTITGLLYCYFSRLLDYDIFIFHFYLAICHYYYTITFLLLSITKL